MNPDERKILNEFLHYMKASPADKRKKKGDNFLLIIKDIGKESKNFCAFRDKKKIDVSCYLLDEDIGFLSCIIKKYILSCEFLDIDPYYIGNLRKIDQRLTDPSNIITHKNFLLIIDNLIELVEHESPNFDSKINKLTCQELIRLDESLHCFEEYCYYSSTIMAVTSVESRLHYLLDKKDSDLYKEHFEDATLGKLIQLFDPKYYTDAKFKKFKKLIPNEYKSLIDILNHYRILSAHPLGKNISKKIVQSVINLSILFLLDERTKIEEESLLVCK